MTEPLMWAAAVLFGVMSAYGWWFYLSVGPAHGPGAELGMVAGTLALLAAALGCWLKTRDRDH